MNYQILNRNTDRIVYLLSEEHIDEQMKETDFSIVYLQVDNWNDDLSPFAYDKFMGKADSTICELKRIIQEVEKEMNIQKRYLGGYSLGGLFALYTAYQTDLFDGVMSCSGSLWFPGMKEYLEKQEERRFRIYLSLGKKEEMTRNQLMREVGNITRWYYERLKDQNADCILKWNEGGHFYQPDKRMIQGLRWLLEMDK